MQVLSKITETFSRFTPNLSKVSLLVTAFLFYTYQIIFPGQWLPDYESYRYIYDHNADMLINNGKDVLFAYIIVASNWLGFDYVMFRNTYISIGLVVLLWGLAQRSVIESKTNGFAIAGGFVVAVMAFITFIEFYQIRIRAGLSIGLMVAAYSIVCFGKTKNIIRLVIAAGIITVSALNHTTTTVILFVYLIIPAVIGSFCNKLDVSYLVSKNSILLLLGMICAVAAFAVYGFFISGVENRGVWVYSNLNPARALLMIFVPLIVSMCIIYNKYCTIKSRKIGTWVFDARSTAMLFVYASCLLCGAVTILLGLDKHAGEGMVRFFTLSSVVSICELVQTRSELNWFWAIVLIGNSSFFINTLVG